MRGGRLLIEISLGGHAAAGVWLQVRQIVVVLDEEFQCLNRSRYVLVALFENASSMRSVSKYLKKNERTIANKHYASKLQR